MSGGAVPIINQDSQIDAGINGTLETRFLIHWQTLHLEIWLSPSQEWSPEEWKELSDDARIWEFE